MNETIANPVGWFEIPVTDIDRAIAFYEATFGVKIAKHEMGPLLMGWFPMYPHDKGASGALVLHKDWYKPSSFEGALIYFTAYSGDVDIELQRAVKAGGKIVQPKKSIGEYGHVAFFIDSEGNRIGLHSKA